MNIHHTHSYIQFTEKITFPIDITGKKYICVFKTQVIIRKQILKKQYRVTDHSTQNNTGFLIVKSHPNLQQMFFSFFFFFLYIFLLTLITALKSEKIFVTKCCHC